MRIFPRWISGAFHVPYRDIVTRTLLRLVLIRPDFKSNLFNCNRYWLLLENVRKDSLYSLVRFLNGALWVIIYDSYLWSWFIMRIWWWWKMDDSYGLKKRLWVILSPQVKSLENWIQGTMDGRIGPNCKRGYKDPRTAKSVELLKKGKQGSMDRRFGWNF